MSDPVVIGPGGRDRRPRPLLRMMLGDVLRRTRLEQGRTLADVARAAKVSMPYLSEVERGLKEASSEVLAAICDALSLEMSDLLVEVGRDLVVGRGWAERQAQVIRLGAIRGPAAPPPLRGATDAQGLLAA
jgi:transcriptional regulator with XRE-family HTH domain